LSFLGSKASSSVSREEAREICNQQIEGSSDIQELKVNVAEIKGDVRLILWEINQLQKSLEGK
jgi:hypothetical protein